MQDIDIDVSVFTELILSIVNGFLETFLSTDAGSIPSDLWNLIMSHLDTIILFVFIVIVMFPLIMWFKK